MHTVMKALVREPLTWFLLLGGLLFLLASNHQVNQQTTIVVDEAQLVAYVRQQSREFEPERAEQRVAQASPEVLADWVQQYVRDEALFREAQALGFAESDYVIRRRLIQRVELLAQGVASTNLEIDDDVAREYFSNHAQRYWRPGRVTFRHIYFAHADDAEREARSALERLHAEPASVANMGQRFLYHLNYVDRTEDFIASHFGTAFAEQIFARQAATDRWQGPFRSTHGWHLVRLSKLEPGFQPEFSAVRDQVLIDVRHAYIRAASEAVIDEILLKYQVDNRLIEPGGT